MPAGGLKSLPENTLKIALVSCRVDAVPERQETRDALDQALARWLAELGYQALLLPNVLDSYTLPSLITQLKPALIVLSGGNDLGQYPARDQTESALVDIARKLQLPLLAICRGMQLLAQTEGVALKTVSGHVARRHMLSGFWQGDVNSYHQFALSELPAHYDLLAQSPDGCIEAMRHQSLPWLALMWHPEREQPFCPLDLSRVQAVLQQEQR